MEAQFEVGKLSATRRTGSGKGPARRLRARGLIPAVLYGSGEAARSLTVDPTVLRASLDPAKGRNTLIALTLDGDDGVTEQVNVMVKDYQMHVLSHELLHVDFIEVGLDQLVEAQVPLSLEGRAAGVKVGGELHQVYRKVPVRATPAAIPAAIVLDVSPMEIGDSRSVGDLILPEGVEILLPETLTVAQVVTPRAIEEEETTDAEGEEGEEGAEAAEGEAEPKAEDAG